MSRRLELSEYVSTGVSSSPTPHDEELPKYIPRANSSGARVEASPYAEPTSPSMVMMEPQSLTYTAFQALTPASSAADPNAPPSYSMHEPLAQTFRIEGELVCSTAPSHTPRYQLSFRTTRSGAAYQLRIRRLLNSEARRLSMPVRKNDKGKQRRSSVDYDDDTTMYIASNHSVLPGLGGAIEIKGYRSSCIRGMIRMETETRTLKGLGSRTGKAWRVTHVTRNVAGDSLREENERKMQRHGYHSESEWNSALLFTVRPKGSEMQWVDAQGKLVATEENYEFKLQGDDAGSVDRSTRDLLVTCWTVKRWYEGPARC